MDKESPEQEEITIEEEIFWVYSYSFNAYDNQLPCDTPDNRHAFCLGISFNEEFDYDISTLAWISPEIEGYTRKSNFIQKLHVIKTEDSKSGQIKRKLVQVLEEERDYIDLLGGDLNFTVGSNSTGGWNYTGGWNVIRYQNEDLPNPSFPNGKIISIHPSTRKAISTDGCNSITLEIKKVGSNQIISFGNLISTLIACPDVQKEIPFPGLFNQFKREGDSLFFYNDSGEEVAVWRKVN